MTQQAPADWYPRSVRFVATAILGRRKVDGTHCALPERASPTSSSPDPGPGMERTPAARQPPCSRWLDRRGPRPSRFPRRGADRVLDRFVGRSFRRSLAAAGGGAASGVRHPRARGSSRDLEHCFRVNREQKSPPPGPSHNPATRPRSRSQPPGPPPGRRPLGAGERNRRGRDAGGSGALAPSPKATGARVSDRRRS